MTVPRVALGLAEPGLCRIALVAVFLIGSISACSEAPDESEPPSTEPAPSSEVAMEQSTEAARADAALPIEDPRLLFYSDRSGNGDLYVFDVNPSDPAAADGSAERSATRVTSDPTSEFAPRWDRARERLIYTVEREGGLWLMARARDGETSELFANPAADESPSWDPLGLTIVYSAPTDPADTEGTGLRDLVIASATTGEPIHALTQTEAIDKQPVFSPTGRRIAFTSNRDGQQEIYVLELDRERRPTAEPVNLTRNPALEGHPAWSPDGRGLLFYRYENGNADLWTVPSDGGEPKSLGNAPGNELIGTYSPDGQWIAFGTARDEDWEIYIMAADGSNPRRLTHRPGFDGNPLWLPSSVLGLTTR